MNVRCVAAGVVALCLTRAGSARAEEIAGTAALSPETDSIWRVLGNQCLLLKDADEGTPAAGSIDPAYQAIVDFCARGAYPAALMTKTEGERAQALEAALTGREYAGPVSPTVGVGNAVAAAGGIGDALLRGLSTVLVKRARAELQALVVDGIRRQACNADPARSFLQHTCAYLGTGQTLGVTLGPALRAAVVADVTALPDVVLARVAPEGSADGLAARLVIITATSLADRVALKPLAGAYRRLVKEWTCDPGDTACPRLATVIARTAGALELIVEAGQLLESLEATPSRENLDHLATFLGTGLKAKLRVSADLDEEQVLALRDAMLEALQAVRQWLAADLPTRRATAGDMVRSVIRLVGVAIDLAESADAARPAPRMPQVLRFRHEATLLVDAVFQADLGAVFTLMITQLQRLTPADRLDGAIRVLALGVELASATTSEEVEATIEAVAAPIGSYRRKTLAPSRALGGLIGLGGTREWIRGARNSLAGGPVGLVGLDLTWPVHDGKLVPGVFLSLLDLGAVFAGRSVEVDSDPAPLRLEHVTALGLHGRLGTRATGPLVLHAGIAWVPNYRTIDSRLADVFRITAGLSVDVTLWPF
jgi:hypothetical protein